MRPFPTYILHVEVSCYLYGAIANEPLPWGDPGQDLDNVRVKYLLIACSAKPTDNFNKSSRYQSQSLSLKTVLN